jgi:hypothetical protein
MNERGEILSAELSPKLTELWDADKKDPSSQGPAAASLDALLKQPLVILPEKEVSAGDQWETSRELQTPAGAFSQKTEYTYEGSKEASGSTAESIAYASTLTAAAQGKAKIKEQAQTGIVLFDAQAGRLVSAEQKQKLVTETPYRGAMITVVVESQVKRTLTAK